MALIGGGQAADVFWQVAGPATLGTGSAFAGNILALTSITVTTGASVNGRVLARNRAVTLDTNTVTRPTGALSISVPATADLGSVVAGTATVSASLGDVTVTDTRYSPDAAWIATVDSTDFHGRGEDDRARPQRGRTAHLPEDVTRLSATGQDHPARRSGDQRGRRREDEHLVRNHPARPGSACR
ncbi:hypothetical protein GCM10018952_76740 [Streptosporangium vulgare]